MAGARGNTRGTRAATSLIVLTDASQQHCCVGRLPALPDVTGSPPARAQPAGGQHPAHIYTEGMRRLRNIKVHFHL